MKEAELIIKAMKKSGKPMKSGEIAEMTKLDKKLVDKAVKVLKDEGKIVSPQRCFYSIK
ncbi:MarR family transcriptional regulator [Bacteroidetes/Chlorobi group bacterium ChocPot_Mid]|nr:MAG: MarR family transcriptional regulator [Bacteroidetes/Chlorobi group bacterium ChocPot_Mid]